jgi:hypothetical protein
MERIHFEPGKSDPSVVRGNGNESSINPKSGIYIGRLGRILEWIFK